MSTAFPAVDKPTRSLWYHLRYDFSDLRKMNSLRSKVFAFRKCVLVNKGIISQTLPRLVFSKMILLSLQYLLSVLILPQLLLRKLQFGVTFCKGGRLFSRHIVPPVILLWI